MSESELLDMCINEVAEEADSDYHPEGEERYDEGNQMYGGGGEDSNQNNGYPDDEYGEEEHHHDPDELEEEVHQPPLNNPPPKKVDPPKPLDPSTTKFMEFMGSNPNKPSPAKQ